MGSLIKKSENEIVTFLHNQKEHLPKPFQQEIYLLTSYIAGTKYVKHIDDICNELNIDDQVSFFREPDNRYDKKAIVIKYQNRKLGYVPRHDNAIISRLMDAGKLIYGKVCEISCDNDFDIFNIDINIYLKD